MMERAPRLEEQNYTAVILLITEFFCSGQLYLPYKYVIYGLHN